MTKAKLQASRRNATNATLGMKVHVKVAKRNFARGNELGSVAGNKVASLAERGAKKASAIAIVVGGTALSGMATAAGTGKGFLLGLFHRG